MYRKLILTIPILVYTAHAQAEGQKLSEVQSSAGKALATSRIVIASTATEPEAIELETVTVTTQAGSAEPEIVIPSMVLSKDELGLKMGHSIGETLKQEQGISSQSFGPGVGTPVIRGQGGPRVRVLQNGIGGNDVSQLSPDHASSVEPLQADSIEVLRGPATLLYSSGAMGGVVNVIDSRIPGFKAERLLGGDLEQRYDTVADETSTALKAEGGQGHITYHLDGFYRDRNNLQVGGQAIDAPVAQSIDSTLHVIQNTNGYIVNTSAHTINGSAGVSLVGDPGFAGVAINRLENNYGIAPDGSGGGKVRIDLKQSKYDFKSELSNPTDFADSMRMRLGYTDYQHTELDDGAPGTAFSNKSYEGRLELVHKAIGPFRGIVGFQAVSSEFAAFDYTGGQTIVPSSQINNFSVFGMETLNTRLMTYQFGLRVEDSSINPQLGTNYATPNGLPISSGYSYTPVSASVSALWAVDANNSLNLALTRSQRAPQVQELLSHGFHDATRSFEEGNPNLQMETAYNLDLGYKFKSDSLRAEFDLFHNWANNYIFQQRDGRFVEQDPNTGLPVACPANTACTAVLQTRQGDAIFKGYEAKLIFPLMENSNGLVDLTLFSDYTRAEFVSGGNLPRIPPLRFGFQLDYAQLAWSANLRFTRADAQTYSGSHETATSGYNLLTFGGQYQIKAFRDAKLLLFAKANNLLNENIRNSTSYLRNFAPEPGRGGELGVRISY